jgi:hypothetical protein
MVATSVHGEMRSRGDVRLCRRIIWWFTMKLHEFDALILASEDVQPSYGRDRLSAKTI